MAGAYLYRLLKSQGFADVELFDIHRSNRCRHKPCAWGVAPYSEYSRLISKIGDPRKFELAHSDTISIDGLRMKADMTMVDKPALIDAMIGGAAMRFDPIEVSQYDRVVDATGCERAYLGPAIGPEVIANCAQYRVRSTKDLGLWFKTSGLGYEWCFPLGGDVFHIGFGNLHPGVKNYRPLDDSGKPPFDGEVLCNCYSRVRLSSPHYSLPFTSGDHIVGVGEAIGTVGPLGADGNLYAMQCAEMLADHWDDLEGYQAAVLKRFDWMRREREALDKMVHGRVPPIRDVRVFLAHSKRVGIEMGPVVALQLFRRVIETSRSRREILANEG
jgi:hypothetical protein